SKSFTSPHCNVVLLKDRLDYSKTWQGQYFNVLGHFFSVYCMWKIFISTVNIVFDRVGKVDPVTRGIEIAVKYMGFQLDVRFWSQHVSFLLVGVIAVTSIRGLLITLTKFFYMLSSTKSSNLIVLLLNFALRDDFSSKTFECLLLFNSCFLFDCASFPENPEINGCLHPHHD
uniref:Abscisic acid G-protein coupled receptor-like domain-containing protein n=1 Tax=Parascaris equorum TaxID=6256 RepID=A0A914RE21_PAREQ